MPPREIPYEELESLAGQEIGVSDWLEITQEMVSRFADATFDHQWIHVDPERARRESPFGGTIAHGYFTLSLAPYLLDQIWRVDGVAMVVNYGLNRLRFPAPTPVGSRLRLRATLIEAGPVPKGKQVSMALSFELEKGGKPVCVAEAVFRYFPARSSGKE